MVRVNGGVLSGTAHGISTVYDSWCWQEPVCAEGWCVRFSHCEMNVAARYAATSVFTAPNKLSKFCPRLRKMAESCTTQERCLSAKLEQVSLNGRVMVVSHNGRVAPVFTTQSKDRCQIKHSRCYRSCKTGMVYQIPFSGGRSYVRHSGRFVKTRLREHESALRSLAGTHLVDHCSSCGCTPIFADTKILSTDRQKINRELIEAFHIRNMGEKSVSQASITLSDRSGRREGLVGSYYAGKFALN